MTVSPFWHWVAVIVLIMCPLAAGYFAGIIIAAYLEIRDLKNGRSSSAGTASGDVQPATTTFPVYSGSDRHDPLNRDGILDQERLPVLYWEDAWSSEAR